MLRSFSCKLVLVVGGDMAKPKVTTKKQITNDSGRGSRATRQRRAILEVLRTTRAHPTAEAILLEVRKTLPRVSMGTVYRNLRLLRDMGEITELSYGRSLSHYDGFVNPHYHLHCTVCDKVQDLDYQLPRKLNNKVAELTQWEIVGHSLEFEGICTTCRRSLARARKGNTLH